MVAISYTTRGLSEIQSGFRNLPRDVRKYVLNEMARITYDGTKAGAAKHKKTGLLEESVYLKEIQTSNRSYNIEVGHDGDLLRREAGVDYSRFVLFKTRPHTIVPKKPGGVLSFEWKGKRWFLKFVKHPGYVGDNYMYAATENAVKQFQSIVNKAFEELK